MFLFNNALSRDRRLFSLKSSCFWGLPETLNICGDMKSLLVKTA